MELSLKQKYLIQDFTNFCWDWLMVDADLDSLVLDEDYISHHVTLSYNRFINEILLEEETKLLIVDLGSVKKEMFNRYVVDFYEENISEKIID